MIALVTGASSGIGRDIARSLAKHGINVIITARRRDRLEKLKKELTETYGVKVHIIAADISDMAQCRELHRRVKKYSIDIFVNNAGFGVRRQRISGIMALGILHGHSLRWDYGIGIGDNDVALKRFVHGLLLPQLLALMFISSKNSTPGIFAVPFVMRAMLLSAARLILRISSPFA